MSRVEGEAEVLAYFDKKLKQIEGPMTNKAVVIIMNEVRAHIAPYVPVDTSTLINSVVQRVQKGKNMWNGEITWMADYAAAVNYGPQKNWQKSGASNRFVEKGVADFTRDSMDAVLKEIYK